MNCAILLCLAKTAKNNATFVLRSKHSILPFLLEDLLCLCEPHQYLIAGHITWACAFKQYWRALKQTAAKGRQFHHKQLKKLVETVR